MSQVSTLCTPKYTFNIGDSIDTRDKNGIWKVGEIISITDRPTTKIYGSIKVSIPSTIIAIEISALNICSCGEYCFHYYPLTQWCSHSVAAPNTQTTKWLELISQYDHGSNAAHHEITDKTTIKKVKKPLQSLQYGFSVIVFGFIRDAFEEIYNKLIPMEMKHVILIYFDHWSNLLPGDAMRIKNEYGEYQGAVVKLVGTYKRYKIIHVAYCPNILRVNDHIDAKDRDGTWYEAQIVAIKPPKKKFPTKFGKPPSKKKKWKKLAAIHVHFIGFGDRFNEWISMRKDVMCCCADKCKEKAHRITFAKTKTDDNCYKIEEVCMKESTFCDCISDECANTEHRFKYTDNWNIVQSKNMFCFC